MWQKGFINKIYKGLIAFFLYNIFFDRTFDQHYCTEIKFLTSHLSYVWQIR